MESQPTKTRLHNNLITSRSLTIETNSMSSSISKRWLAAIKAVLFVLVLWYVGRKGFELVRSEDWQRFQIQPLWLVLSAVLYLVGWLPSVLVWQRLMRQLGARPPFALSMKAYYFGHLGKYVPGKAVAIAVRTTTLQAVGVPVATSLSTAIVETLLVMGVGLGIGLALGPLLLPEEGWQHIPQFAHVLRQHVWLGPTVVATSASIAVPLTARWLMKFAQRKAKQPVVDAMPLGPTFDQQDWRRELIRGISMLTSTWFAQGLSLGCVLIALGAVDSVSLLDWMLWTGAIGLGNSLGFFVLFAPGGLGVREAILIAVLSPTVGQPTAIAASGLLRLAWLVGELIVAALLGWFVPTAAESQPKNTTSIPRSSRN